MNGSSIRRAPGILAIILIGGGAIVAYRWAAPRAPTPPILGVVHQTEIRIAPETSGRLASFRVTRGQEVRKGDILAKLSSPELEASLQEAKAAAASARAQRANVDAGTRQEVVDAVSQDVKIADANYALALKQYTRVATLASKSFASKQQLDETTAAMSKARSGLDLAQANYAQSKAGPTKEERAVAETNVELADASVAALEAKLDKTTLVAPVDGIVGLLVAEPGEAISAGQPVLTLDVGRAHWFTFTIREDLLAGLTVGSSLQVLTEKGDRVETRVTELRPLGEFAVWRAARAVGDHDVNSFLLRADPVTQVPALESGMTVWIDR